MTKPSKQSIETAKTVVIAVLITAIVAFVGGMKYHAHQTAQVRSAVIEATSKQ